MIEMFKLSHNFYDPDVYNNFLVFKTTVPRGHVFSLYKRGTNKGLDLRRFYFKLGVVDQWNNLPAKIVNAFSLYSFKDRIDKMWRNNENDIYFNSTTDFHQITSARSSRSVRLQQPMNDEELMPEA